MRFCMNFFNYKFGALVVGAAFCLIVACNKAVESPTPYRLQIPSSLPQTIVAAAQNPMTVEGVELGRHLFYEPLLSGNNQLSCGSCHKPDFAFSDSTIRFSQGTVGQLGTRNAMPLFNLAFTTNFFWDGGAANLESQVLGPIENPLEMAESLPRMLNDLRQTSKYPNLFRSAFGDTAITTPRVMKAVAQFMKTILSGDSKYDKYKKGLIQLTDSELRGLAVFQDETTGDCVHCHVLGSTFTDFEYRNNGLDDVPNDKGRERITLNPLDRGKFKTPTLRNIALTAPYMHDGRFANLDEVLQHYNQGFSVAPTTDPIISTKAKNRMSSQHLADLKAFLLTLTDDNFAKNPNFLKPR